MTNTIEPTVSEAGAVINAHDMFVKLSGHPYPSSDVLGVSLIDFAGTVLRVAADMIRRGDLPVAVRGRWSHRIGSGPGHILLRWNDVTCGEAMWVRSLPNESLAALAMVAGLNAAGISGPAPPAI